jgi:hypothetical protein
VGVSRRLHSRRQETPRVLSCAPDGYGALSSGRASHSLIRRRRTFVKPEQASFRGAVALACFCSPRPTRHTDAHSRGRTQRLRRPQTTARGRRTLVTSAGAHYSFNAQDLWPGRMNFGQAAVHCRDSQGRAPTNSGVSGRSFRQAMASGRQHRQCSTGMDRLLPRRRVSFERLVVKCRRMFDAPLDRAAAALCKVYELVGRRRGGRALSADCRRPRDHHCLRPLKALPQRDGCGE